MCLIITGSANKVRTALLETEGLLLDVFKTNPDGIGVMYATKNKLKIVKTLPKSLEDAQKFIERMPTDERSLAIHFRWTTHGDTDLVNCHPYTVVEGEVALMHNGVLRTGNSKDKSKSDTWHFIEDYLKGSVAMAPGIVFDPGYAALVREYIGSSNRFVLMGKDGRMIILNKKEGLEHEGLWFSNTYAWTPKLLIAGYQKWHGNTRSYGGYVNHWDEDDSFGYGEGYTRTTYYPQGGGQSSGPKSSGVTHNRPQLPEGTVGRATQGQTGYSSPTQAPAASSPAIGYSQSGGTGAAGGTSFTQADAQAEAEWERTVRQSHKEWQRDASATIPTSGPFADKRIADNDPPEEGEEGQVAAAGEVALIHPPTRGELIQALADSSADALDLWLTDYPQVTISLLFHLYKAAPTKWTPVESLMPYEQTLYKAFIAGNKSFLIEEARKNDGTAALMAEIVCFYLNWYAWPEVRQPSSTVFPFPRNAPAKGASTPEEVAPTVEDPKGDSHVEASSAQMAQGGDGASMGDHDNSIYIG